MSLETSHAAWEFLKHDLPSRSKHSVAQLACLEPPLSPTPPRRRRPLLH
jgi:hypothetical protein